MMCVGIVMKHREVASSSNIPLNDDPDFLRSLGVLHDHHNLISLKAR